MVVQFILEFILLMLQKNLYKEHTYENTTLPVLENGYVAWTLIHNWNSDALYTNYEAIKTALCYPKDPCTVSTNSDVDNIVTGNTFENRWYLPTCSELQNIHKVLMGSGDAILNKQEILTAANFWSANVMAENETYEKDTNAKNNINNNAKYVLFDNSSSKIKISDKATKYNVIPIAQFEYK